MAHVQDSTARARVAGARALPAYADTLALVGVFGVALALYVRTSAPSLLTGDQAEHQFTAFLVGVPHATGYPLFTMINALAVRLLPWGDVAWRVTLMTALWSALAIMVAAMVARMISGSTLAGICAAATLAVTREFWSLAVIAEVYTLQALLILVCWRCLLSWWATRTPRWLYGACFVAGIATTHHGSFVPIVVPALLFAVILPLFVGMQRLALRAALGIVARCISAGALGLAPWLYLAAQFALFHPFDYYRGQGLPYHYYWGNPLHWNDVANLALGAGFRNKVFTHGWDNLLVLELRFVATLRAEVWWTGFVLGGLGGVGLLLRQPLNGRFSSLVLLSAALFGINVAGDIPKAHVYYLPAYVIWSVWAGIGVGWLAQQTRTHAAALLAHRSAVFRAPAQAAQWLAQLGLCGTLLLTLLIGRHRFALRDRSADDVPHRFAVAALQAAAPGAVLLCRWELCEPIRYVQFVEGQRRDVILDQTEPEDGSGWAARAALYAPSHPVYAVQFDPLLARRYRLTLRSELGQLWEVHSRDDNH